MALRAEPQIHFQACGCCSLNRQRKNSEEPKKGRTGKSDAAEKLFTGYDLRPTAAEHDDSETEETDNCGIGAWLGDLGEGHT